MCKVQGEGLAVKPLCRTLSLILMASTFCSMDAKFAGSISYRKEKSLQQRFSTVGFNPEASPQGIRRGDETRLHHQDPVKHKHPGSRGYQEDKVVQSGKADPLRAKVKLQAFCWLMS